MTSENISLFTFLCFNPGQCSWSGWPRLKHNLSLGIRASVTGNLPLVTPKSPLWRFSKDEVSSQASLGQTLTYKSQLGFTLGNESPTTWHWPGLASSAPKQLHFDCPEQNIPQDWFLPQDLYRQLILKWYQDSIFPSSETPQSHVSEAVTYNGLTWDFESL